MRVMTCKTCSSRLYETEFYKQNSVLGRMTSCKECVKERARAYRAENLEKVKEYDRERGRLPHRLEANRVRARDRTDYSSRVRYKDKFPERRAAHLSLQYAIRSGKIERRANCERCAGTYCVNGHHEDYSKPLDVIWLCKWCHGQRHREINAERRVTASQTSAGSPP